MRPQLHSLGSPILKHGAKVIMNLNMCTYVQHERCEGEGSTPCSLQVTKISYLHTGCCENLDNLIDY
jgi:hypothetical protein